MPTIARIDAYADELTAIRRDLHAHPEIGFEEVRTSGIVADKLKSWGIEVHRGLGGVVGVIRGRGERSNRSIGLRADMDALPLAEQTGAPYASTSPGRMHACGHDGHTAMLLGAARYLAETRNFDGTVYVIFQPAEENAGGGEIMVKEGLFERFPMQHVFGLHNWPGLPLGHFHWRNGPTMAAVGTVEITVFGRGSHAARPERGIDPIVVAAQIVTALQTIVSRSLDPVDSGLVTIGGIHGGEAHNIIPESVRMIGTARWFAPAVGDTLEAGVRRIATGIAASLGASAEVVFNRMYPPTVNDPEATALARRAAEAVAGAARVAEMDKPTMGGEDFAFMLEKKPGSYIMLGTGRTGADPELHNPRYDFNDEALPIGASYWVTLAEQLLPRRA
jgi:hippurate hydrolase